jgi:hypothetical protein
LAEAVDSALLSLGDSAREAIYFHLKAKFKIKKREIPNRLEDFQEGLEKIFGDGARFLEILIMKKLCEEIGKPLDWPEGEDLVFLNYIALAKQSFSEMNG